MLQRFALKILLCFSFVWMIYGFTGLKTVNAEVNEMCVGTGIADYAAVLLAARGDFKHVKLLSPAFNLTSRHLEGIVAGMESGLQAHGFSINNFDFVAGNAYNVYSGTTLAESVSSFINRARTTAIGNNPIVLTETGWFPPTQEVRDSQGTIDDIRNELSTSNLNRLNIHAAVLFNIFNTGNASDFFYHSLPSEIVKERICDNEDCSRLGANSANYFDPGSNDNVYGEAEKIGMRYVVEIANEDPIPVIETINNAPASITPIIRIGTAHSVSQQFLTPDGYLDFIKAVDAGVNRDVYVIAGPNEPETECWWDTDNACFPSGSCGTVGDAEGIPRTIKGKISSDSVLNETINSRNIEITNAPVTGATVCAYGGTYLTTVGKSKGNIPNLEAMAVTDGNGEYVIETTWRSSGDRRSFEDSNYLAVYCGPKLVDVYKVGLACGDVTMPTITIDCDRYTNPLTACLEELPYVDRNGYLMCADEGIQRGKTALLHEVEPRIRIKFDTNQQDGFLIGLVKTRTDMLELVEGRYALKNSLADLRYKLSPYATLVGGFTRVFEVPKEGEEQTYPSCDSVNGSANNEIGVLRDSSTEEIARWSVAVTLSSPSFEGDGIPGDLKRLYEETDIETPVCVDESNEIVELRAFKPPWNSECGSYRYCDGFPYYALYGSPLPRTQRVAHKTKDDTYNNIEEDGVGELNRQFILSDKTGDKPFKAGNIVKIPHSDTASKVTSDYTNNAAVPSFVVDTPTTTRGWNSSVPGANPPKELRLQSQQCKVWRLGIQQAMCTCSDLDTDCNDPNNTFAVNDIDDEFVSGYDYENENGKGSGTWFGDTLVGHTLSKWISKLFAWFVDPQDCNNIQKNNLISCVLAADTNKACSPEEELLCNTDSNEVICTYSDITYHCAGYVEHRLVGGINLEEGKDAEVSPGFAEFALTLLSPVIDNDPENKEIMDLCGYDSVATNELNVNLREGYGADRPCAPGTSTPQMASIMYQSVRDPVFKNTGDPLSPVDPGGIPGDGGDPPPPGGGQCNEFNCFGSDVDTFEKQLACAVGSLSTGLSNNYGVAGGNVAYMVDRYGPYCDNETRNLPWGYNLASFYDANATVARSCRALPPTDVPTDLIDPLKMMTQGCQGRSFSHYSRQFGYEPFDYYREAFLQCPFPGGTTGGRWPTGVTVESVYEDACGDSSPYSYSGYGVVATSYNCDGGKSSRTYRVIEAAQGANVNPWIVLGTWATESWWGQTPRCLGET